MTAVWKQQQVTLIVTYKDDDRPARAGLAPSQWDWWPLGDRAHIESLAPRVEVPFYGEVVTLGPVINK